ncbi:MAG: hypothetical protein ABL921_04560 [Pirellula sp.]
MAKKTPKKTPTQKVKVPLPVTANKDHSETIYNFMIDHIHVFESIRINFQTQHHEICRVLSEARNTPEGTQIRLLTDLFVGNTCWKMGVLKEPVPAKQDDSSIYRIFRSSIRIQTHKAIRTCYPNDRFGFNSKDRNHETIQIDIGRNEWILSLRCSRSLNTSAESPFGIAFICFQPNEKASFRIGQSVSDDGSVLSPTEMFVELDHDCGDGHGVMTRVLINTVDHQSMLMQSDSFRYCLTDVEDRSSGLFDLTNTYMLDFGKHFDTWRNLFNDHAKPIAKVIAETFNQSRYTGDFHTVPFSEQEMVHAFTSSQKFAFEVSDLNDFAGNWISNVAFHDLLGNKAFEFTKHQVWLPVTPIDHNFVQRKTAATDDYVDPRTVTGKETGLIELILQAYVPEWGLQVGWLSKYQPFPVKDPSGKELQLFFETPLLAYRLPGHRFLWLSQRFTRQDIEMAGGKTSRLPLPNQYDIAIEWMETGHEHRCCFLVNDTFEFSSNQAKFVRAPGAMLLKARHLGS